MLRSNERPERRKKKQARGQPLERLTALVPPAVRNHGSLRCRPLLVLWRGAKDLSFHAITLQQFQFNSPGAGAHATRCRTAVHQVAPVVTSYSSHRE